MLKIARSQSPEYLELARAIGWHYEQDSVIWAVQRMVASFVNSSMPTEDPVVERATGIAFFSNRILAVQSLLDDLTGVGEASLRECVRRYGPVQIHVRRRGVQFLYSHEWVEGRRGESVHFKHAIDDLAWLYSGKVPPWRD